MTTPGYGGSRLRPGHGWRRNSRRSTLSAIGAALILAAGAPSARQAEQAPVFRTGTSLVSVDVVVRDGSGDVVRGLTAGDFTITEDGRAQRIQTFTFQEVASQPSVRSLINGLQSVVLSQVQ